MARKQITSEEKRRLETCIGSQLQKSDYALIAINGKHYRMNYCILNKNKSSFSNDVVAPVTGFGSGWAGIALLGSELTKLGYEVAMPSLLGYGNSDNPPVYNRHDFLCEAAALHVWACKVLPGKRIHWVGHSMASAIITELAKMSPERVASLTLLDPVGFNKRGMLELAMKFATNGIGHTRDFSGDPKMEIIKKFLPKQKSSYSSDRIKQRISEWKRLCEDNALEALNEVIYDTPVRCIYGEKDTVSPYAINCDGMLYVPLPGLWHNTTMYGSEETAKAIDSFVSELIKRRRLCYLDH